MTTATAKPASMTADKAQEARDRIGGLVRELNVLLYGTKADGALSKGPDRAAETGAAIMELVRAIDALPDDEAALKGQTIGFDGDSVSLALKSRVVGSAVQPGKSFKATGNRCNVR